MVDYKFFFVGTAEATTLSSYRSLHPMRRQFFLRIGHLVQRNYYNLSNPALYHTIRFIYSPPHHIEMAKCFNGRAQLLGWKACVQCVIRRIRELHFQIWMFFNAVSTTRSNRCGSTATKNYIVKLFIVILAQKVWNNVAISQHFENCML